MNPGKQMIHQWIWLALLLFLAVGMVYPVIGAIALICMVAPVLVAFFQGRSWCGTYCPRGSFNDVLLSKISFKGKIPALLTQPWFRSTFLILLMSAFAFQLVRVWGNPTAIGWVFVRMITVTTLITLVLGVLYQPRTWCRICPMGTIAKYVAQWRMRFNPFQLITFTNNACVNCKVCTKNCPLNIDVPSYKEKGQVTHPDCLKCSVCVAKCPKKALKIG